MTIKKANLSPSETTLRIGATMALPAVLRALGEDPESLFAEVGISISLFDNPNNRISYVARGNLLSHCVAKTGCNHLGLLIGQQAGLSSLGLVGLLVKYSVDVGTALESLSRYMHLHVQGAVATLDSDGKTATLGYAAYRSDAKSREQVGDGAVAVIFNILRELCGANWKPLKVHFVHKAPDDLYLYRRFFNAPLIFNSFQNAVEFDAKWLEKILPAFDEEILRLLQDQIAHIEAQEGTDFPEKVRSVLRPAILTGNAGSNQIAAMFQIHSRTLNRRLQEFGLNFQNLLDECKFETARQLLEESNIDIAKIADLLAFADVSSFTRTFKRWSGTTPAKWRLQKNNNQPEESDCIGPNAARKKVRNIKQLQEQ